MENKRTLWSLFQKNNLSRRDFLKACVALTTIMGLPPDKFMEVAEAAETKVLTPLVWLHGHECTGCDESFIRSSAPWASDVILNMISLEYNDALSAAAGEPFEHHLEEIQKQHKGKFLLAVSGGIPIAEDGVYCMVSGKPFYQSVKEAAKNAAAVIEYGSCAAWGGIQAAKPNPSGSVSVSEIVSGTPIMKVPGCPPIPEVMTGVVMHYAMFNSLPPLDSNGRPRQFFGNRIHDTCYRRPFFDSGMFVENFDDVGSKAGWCLYKMGCRGPETYNSCGNMRWWNGLSYPIQSGAPCIGCSSDKFWDHGPFNQRLANIPVPNTIIDADRAGIIAVTAAAAGVAIHGAASVIAKHQHKDEKDQDMKG